ncbi:DNA-directed RNA polymerase core subunit rpc10 [Madurella fahalii]|uniref:DNA-directed RNA polymerase core subunit rpc10 n=1 Tax=Madurella fahalii TaxID=1157608 RepID=A0ABQ0GNR1_9PEZI
MSREQYQIPTNSGSGFGGGSGAPASRDYAGESGGGAMTYLCGDCAARVPLEKGAPIRCNKCGARVLYKERTKRMVQFEAR